MRRKHFCVSCRDLSRHLSSGTGTQRCVWHVNMRLGRSGREGWIGQESRNRGWLRHAGPAAGRDAFGGRSRVGCVLLLATGPSIRGAPRVLPPPTARSVPEVPRALQVAARQTTSLRGQRDTTAEVRRANGVCRKRQTDCSHGNPGQVLKRERGRKHSRSQIFRLAGFQDSTWFETSAWATAVPANRFGCAVSEGFVAKGRES